MLRRTRPWMDFGDLRRNFLDFVHDSKKQNKNKNETQKGLAQKLLKLALPCAHSSRLNEVQQ
jgi:hypothetical protein